MERDYIPSKKYSQLQIQSLDIPCYYQDSCINEYAEFILCVRKNPVFNENALIQSLPFANFYTSCKVFKNVWEKCQQFREEEIFEEMRKLYMKSNMEFDNKKSI